MPDFVLQRSVSTLAVYDRGFFKAFFDHLRAAGFAEIGCLLPTSFHPDTRSLTSDQLLVLNQRVPGLLIRSTHPDTHDELRLLMVNDKKPVMFDDGVFASITGNTAIIHVTSDDPIRCFGLVNYFREYIRDTASGYNVVLIPLLIASLVFLIGELFSITNGRLFLHWRFGAPPWTDIFFTVAALILFGYVSSRPAGISLQERKSSLAFARDFLQGRFKDNPLVNFIVTVLGTIVGGIIVILLARAWGLSKP